jgi:uncharacterized membrane protein YedE/YeeE
MKPYWNPYRAGVALGLVLLATFAVMGHGIGASGAFAAAVAAGEQQVAPAHAAANGYYASYVSGGRDPLASWIVFEILGVLTGGFLSAWLAGRVHRDVERGPRTGARTRLAWGFAGGVLMGFASRLARGCTSGQALTGGALLSVGSWVFMIAIFVAGYAFAPVVRRQWT